MVSKVEALDLVGAQVAVLGNPLQHPAISLWHDLSQFGQRS
jgi:hypothetical protein